ncbi:MAG: hypothetical protein KJN63_10330 [Acidimicrobiia bacterium]|nr:hypothetical protein [Acidimicrobiia bacterium]RZV48381.1 MAG: hypothetical protein EX269_01875 [Acidimicrobiales bacterium]
MRFFLPSSKIGSLEYFAIMGVLNAAAFYLVRVWMDASVTFGLGTEDPIYSYDSGAIELGTAGALLLAMAASLTVIRRLTTAGMPAAMFPLLIAPWFVGVSAAINFEELQASNVPIMWMGILGFAVVSTVLQLLVGIATPSDEKVYAPHGDNPNDPNSWVERPAPGGAGPAVTFQGEELRLPGEDKWDSAA